MTIVHIVGIDPGVIHTGCVRFIIDTVERTVDVGSEVVDGLDPAAAKAWAMSVPPVPRIYIEKYRARKALRYDESMLKAEAEFKKAMPRAELVHGTGIKSVVRPGLLQLLGLWKFDKASHHQDLKSAARIAVLGCMKEPMLNSILASIVKDAVDGDPWAVLYKGVRM